MALTLARVPRLPAPTRYAVGPPIRRCHTPAGRIEELSPGECESASAGLAEVKVDCVDDGASVGFLAPLGMEQATVWWREAVRAPGARTWVARSDDGVVHGCVQLKPAHFPNGRLAPTTIFAKRLQP